MVHAKARCSTPRYKTPAPHETVALSRHFPVGEVCIASLGKATYEQHRTDLLEMVFAELLLGRQLGAATHQHLYRQHEEEARVALRAHMNTRFH